MTKTELRKLVKLAITHLNTNYAQSVKNNYVKFV